MNMIKVLRTEKNLTQVQLAKFLEVGQSTIVFWENGNCMPRADKLPKLAEILGCTVDDLFKNTK